MIIAVIIYKSTAVIKGTLNDLKNVIELGTLTTTLLVLIPCPVAHSRTKDMHKKYKGEFGANQKSSTEKKHVQKNQCKQD